jgi:hypothetical protein
MNPVSVFATIRPLITVGQVQTAVLQLSLDELFSDVFEVDPDTREPVLVVEREVPIGWVDPMSPDNDDVVPILPSQILSATTPLTDATILFAERQPAMLDDFGVLDHSHDLAFFFVLDDSRISGILRWGDLFKAPGRLCLFALTLELEEAALELCSKFAGQCWDAIPEQRRTLAWAVHRKRYGESDEKYIQKLSVRVSSGDGTDLLQAIVRDLIDCTTFIDKATMITKCNLLVDFSNEKIRRLFSRAERIRNACAHPAGGDDLGGITTPGKLAELIRECQLLIDEIKTVTPR